MTPGRGHVLAVWSTICISIAWAVISTFLVAFRCHPSHPWTDTIFVSECTTIVRPSNPSKSLHSGPRTNDSSFTVRQMAVHCCSRHHHRNSPIRYLGLPSMGHPNVPKLQVPRCRRLWLPSSVCLNHVQLTYYQLTLTLSQRHRHRWSQTLLPQL